MLSGNASSRVCGSLRYFNSFPFQNLRNKKKFKSTHISLFLYQGIDCRSKIVDLDGKRVRLQIW